jgi:hypothetical protein
MRQASSLPFIGIGCGLIYLGGCGLMGRVETYDGAPTQLSRQPHIVGDCSASVLSARSFRPRGSWAAARACFFYCAIERRERLCAIAHLDAVRLWRRLFWFWFFACETDHGIFPPPSLPIWMSSSVDLALPSVVSRAGPPPMIAWL